jgi:cell division transport system permease protein
MKISTVKYFAKDSLRSLTRNKTISIASIATVAATLFILGVFILTLMNINLGILGVESKVEVKAFLKDDITITQQKDLLDKIKSVHGVTDEIYESKSEALQNLKTQLGEQNKGLLQGFDANNPMPASYTIKVDKPETITNVVAAINGSKGIESIKDGREVINKILVVTNTIKWVGTIIFIILVGVSLFLIGNTIKITVYSRRREIGIMKYIGATDWFIRWPFIIEGMIIGVIGSIVAILLVYYAYRFTYMKVSLGMLMIQLLSPNFVLTGMLWVFILSGILIGAVGSIIAIRKFLLV